MPNFKSDTVTAQELAAANAGKIVADAALTSGGLHFIQGKLTVPAGTAVADTLEIVKVPSGAVIIPAMCSVVGPDQPAGAAVALGFTGEATAVSAATLLDGGAGVKLLTSNVGSYKNTSRRSLIGTISGAGLTAGDVIYFNIACVFAG